MNFWFITFLINIIRQQIENISLLEMLATILVFVIITNLIWLFMERLGNHVVDKSKKKIILIIIIYSVFTYYITFDSRTPGTQYDIRIHLDFGNLKGDYLAKQQLIYTILNVFLFIPYGVCGCLLKKECNIIRRVFICTLASFVVSFIIEIAQLLTQRGYFEVGDLVTNTFGGLLGVSLVLIYELFGVFRKNFKGDQL